MKATIPEPVSIYSSESSSTANCNRAVNKITGAWTLKATSTSPTSLQPIDVFNKMADKGKGKSYWPFKKAKNDFDGTVTKDEKKMSGARNDEGETGVIIAGDMEGVSYEGSRMEGLGERSNPGSLGRAKHEAIGNSGLEGPRYRNRAILEMEDALMNRSRSTRHSRDIVEQRSEKTLAEDPQSYSLSVTTIQQQAMKESNFIGSAFFYNLNLYEVCEL